LFYHFIWTASKIENAEHIEYPNPNPNGLPQPPTGVNGQPRREPEEEDDGEGSAKYRAKFVARTERDHHLAQLTDELALKSLCLNRPRRMQRMQRNVQD
jgi:hypothetical protein